MKSFDNLIIRISHLPQELVAEIHQEQETRYQRLRKIVVKRKKEKRLRKVKVYFRPLSWFLL